MFVMFSKKVDMEWLIQTVESQLLAAAESGSTVNMQLVWRVFAQADSDHIFHFSRPQVNKLLMCASVRGRSDCL